MRQFDNPRTDRIKSSVSQSPRQNIPDGRPSPTMGPSHLGSVHLEAPRQRTYKGGTRPPVGLSRNGAIRLPHPGIKQRAGHDKKPCPEHDALRRTGKQGGDMFFSLKCSWVKRPLHISRSSMPLRGYRGALAKGDVSFCRSQGARFRIGRLDGQAARHPVRRRIVRGTALRSGERAQDPCGRSPCNQEAPHETGRSGFAQRTPSGKA